MCTGLNFKVGPARLFAAGGFTIVRLYSAHTQYFNTSQVTMTVSLVLLDGSHTFLALVVLLP